MKERQSPSQKSEIFASTLRRARSAALTAHWAVIHYRRLRFAYPLHKGAFGRYRASATNINLSNHPEPSKEEYQ